MYDCMYDYMYDCMHDCMYDCMYDCLLICNLSTNSHICETMAYTASEVFGNELNVKTVVYIRKLLR